MYQLKLDDGNQISVRYKSHNINYGIDGSLPNPLEAAYAAIAGCAGVYARKACKSLDISAEGIEINFIPIVRAGNTLFPKRLETEVRFPERINSIQRQRIVEEINQCAVKKLIQDGASIKFVTTDRVPDLS
jgi:uncharacterized OsmC-like protein